MGLAHMLYLQLAVKKSAKGFPVYVFLDRHCLPYGHIWGDGLSNGLRSAKIIILLMSDKVCVSFV